MNLTLVEDIFVTYFDRNYVNEDMLKHCVD